MAKKPVKYDIPHILQRFRAFLLGREHTSALRWAKDIAPKTQPLPDLPPGPHSRLAGNYYYSRDPRGEVKRPEVLYDGEAEMLNYSGCATLKKQKKPKISACSEIPEREGEDKSGKGGKDAKGEKGDNEVKIVKQSMEKEKDGVEKKGETEKSGEKEEEGKKSIEKVEEEVGGAVRRIPGKVWQWDLLEDGDPSKKLRR